MSDSPNHQSKRHSSAHVDPTTGQTHLIRADNTADALRLELERAVEDYGLRGRVEFAVEALDGPWVRLDVRFTGDLDEDDWSGLPTDIEKAMQGLPHGYYEVRERGQNQDGTHLWFVARHDGGPVI